MKYYKVHQGKKNIYSKTAVDGNFIGLDHGMPSLLGVNLRTSDLKEQLKKIYEANHDKPTVRSMASGVGNMFRFLSLFQEGDRVLIPLGDGTYRVGEITGGYYYAGEGEPVPHRRSVLWSASLDKEHFSENLRNSLGSIGTIADVTSYSQEIEALLSGDKVRIEQVANTVDQGEFALESHLEEFLIENWDKTDLGRDYDLFKNDDGEVEASQYPTEVGFIDILALKKDGSEILVIELKKGRSGDAVVGQVLRYITAIKEELAEENQKVRGLVITGSDDKKIRYAIAPIKDIVGYMVYEVSFKLRPLIDTK